MENLEVLAPVGSFKNLKLAINSGANAVYFGVKSFNARQKAENIDLEQLPEFIKIAHLHNIKAYMTLNTLIKNDEFEDVLRIVDIAIESGVDAFIVQDIGLATYLLKFYKNIVLHASTQMGIHNLAGAKFLEDLGFKRVVLSRETKLEDIIEIKNNTNLEIEYFVQGALCVAFSGNCYFSSLCFNESGNRGKCLQPCRMFYEAFSKNKKIKEGFLLSPKDLCMINQINELIKAGITSFKIEGRLRRESYLVQAVSSYVKVIFDKKINVEEEIKKLKKVFARGDYNYGHYLLGNDNIIDTINANHRGEKIGKVINFKPFKNLYTIELELNRKINSGDGIKIINGSRELSLGIGNVDVLSNGHILIYTKYKPFSGDVFLALDSEYESNLIPKDKKIPLEIFVEGRINKPLKIIVKNDENLIKIESDFVCEKAKNQPVVRNDFVEIFKRIKDTEFEIKTLDVILDDIFIAKSIINKMKNMCIFKIEKTILDNVNKLKENIIKIGEYDKKYGLNDGISNNSASIIGSDEDVVNDKNLIIFSPDFYNLKIVKNFIDKNKGRFIYLNLPIICTNNEVKIIDEILKHFGTKNIGVYVNNYWGLKYLKTGFKTIIGYNMNVVNNWSKEFYKSIGIIDFVRSIEFNLTDGLIGGLTYCGRPTLMTWCHCPYKVSCGSNCNHCNFNNSLNYKLNDGKEFKIRRYKIINCYFELLSNKLLESKAKNKIVDMRK